MTDNGNFLSDATRTVVLGECRCPGTPHEQDTAEVREELAWDVLVDADLLIGAAAYRCLVLGALASWNLVDEDGEPVPITPEIVGRLRSDRLISVAGAVNEAAQRARSPLPNASGAPSRPARRESAQPIPTIRPRERRGK